MAPKGWIVDTEPYHVTHRPTWDNGSLTNSLEKNSHTFNIAKFYKEYFHQIPRLQRYDIVVWMDSTVKLKSAHVSTYLFEHIQDSTIVAWNFAWRRHLQMEVASSVSGPLAFKYTARHCGGQDQPFQDVEAQYKTYLSEGYNPKCWRKLYSEDIPRFGGVWSTRFIAWDMTNPIVKEFLELWYWHNLKYTTQDQVSFPYVAHKFHLKPLTLPNRDVGGDCAHNEFYSTKNHGT